MFRVYNETSGDIVKHPHGTINKPVTTLQDLLECEKNIYNHTTSFDILQLAQEVYTTERTRGSTTFKTLVTIYDDVEQSILMVQLDLERGIIQNDVVRVIKHPRESIDSYTRIVKCANEYMFGVNGALYRVRVNKHGRSEIKKWYEFDGSVAVDLVTIDSTRILVATLTPERRRISSLIMSEFKVFLVDVDKEAPIGYIYRSSMKIAQVNMLTYIHLIFLSC